MCRLAWVVALSALVVGALAASHQADTNAIVNSDRVNLRGRPSLSSEVVTQLRKGEAITVLEPVKTGRDETWYRIRLPSDTPVWVHAEFVNPTNKTVLPPRLNVRAGPGEGYSVLCRLAKGETVKELRVVDAWMEIEAPAAACAYVDARYVTVHGPLAPETTPGTAGLPATPPAAPVRSDPAPANPPAAKPAPPADRPAGATATPSDAARPGPPPPPPALPAPASTNRTARPSAPAPAPAAATNAAGPASPVASAPRTNTPPASAVPPAPRPPNAATNAAPTAASAPPTAATNAAPAAVVPAPPDRPLPKRVVRREGVVTGTTSIQAPTPLKLRSAVTRRDLNYLWPASREVRLEHFKGQRVIVTGEEQIEPRWPGLPMIEVQHIVLAP